MINSSVVLEKIASSFEQMPYPGDLNIVYDNSGYHLECVDIQKIFANKHWNELTLETLLAQNSALAFMTPQAYRFYLPAYLSIVIREFEEAEVLIDNTVFDLTLPVEADILNKLNIIQNSNSPLSDGNQDMISQILIDELSYSTQKVHRFIERMSGFNQQQGQAIRYFLEYLNFEKQDDFLNNEPRVAIERYWFIFPL
ncbi:MAG TPA: DUF6714 family protein [Nostocaceae cyanobacterium]|nr:DUF6714 family protein [Nostocaceae cyanobacterium]